MTAPRNHHLISFLHRLRDWGGICLTWKGKFCRELFSAEPIVTTHVELIMMVIMVMMVITMMMMMMMVIMMTLMVINDDDGDDDDDNQAFSRF